MPNLQNIQTKLYQIEIVYYDAWRSNECIILNRFEMLASFPDITSWNDGVYKGYYCRYLVRKVRN